jgi:UDP-3-O-acyl-N-acetylglucosamine deacetylase
VAVPDDAFRVAATIEFDHPLIRRQFGAYLVTPDEFGRDIGRARTFGFLRDAEALRERGLVQGVSFDNAVILDETGVASGELRWTDEFVRHKAGDIIGDLALIGKRLRAQIIANRPSHAATSRSPAPLRWRSPAAQPVRRSSTSTRSCSTCRIATRCCWWTASSISSTASALSASRT